MRARARAIVVFLGLALPVLALAGQASTGCVFDSADDCVLTLGFGCPRVSSGTTSSGSGGRGGNGGHGGSGGGGGKTVSSSAGGTGGMPECLGADAAPCPDVPAGLCASLGTTTCMMGACGVTYTPGEAPSQQYGSCKERLCDASGTPSLMNDDSNVYDDGNPCTTKTCTAGTPSDVPVATSTPCMLMGMSGYCEPDPYDATLVTCAECDVSDSSTCSGFPAVICMKGQCVASTCNNGVKDPGETDVDCGGACLKCSTNKICASYMDCASQVCAAGKCAAPTCSDNRQNQDETDVDCGGATCGQPCADTLKCLVASDCVSGVCKASMPGVANTCQTPTCTDGVQNGDEAGLDCGGMVSMCPPCAAAM